MRSTRGGAFDVLMARLAEAVADGELPRMLDIAKPGRFLQTVQSGMAIRARDGAERAELQSVAEVAIAGWDGFVARAVGRKSGSVPEVRRGKAAR